MTLLKYSLFELMAGEFMDFVYKFPVVRGVQAGSEYYIVIVLLKMLSKLFPSDEGEYVFTRI